MSLPKKPKFGSPCNGCGVCCALQLCRVAEGAFPGASAPCPALIHDLTNNRAMCGLVLIEAKAMEIDPKLKPMIAEGLGIGIGCGMEDE